MDCIFLWPCKPRGSQTFRNHAESSLQSHLMPSRPVKSDLDQGILGHGPRADPDNGIHFHVSLPVGLETSSRASLSQPFVHMEAILKLSSVLSKQI